MQCLYIYCIATDNVFLLKVSDQNSLNMWDMNLLIPSNSTSNFGLDKKKVGIFLNILIQVKTYASTGSITVFILLLTLLFLKKFPFMWEKKSLPHILVFIFQSLKYKNASKRGLLPTCLYFFISFIS